MPYFQDGVAQGELRLYEGESQCLPDILSKDYHSSPSRSGLYRRLPSNGASGQKIHPCNKACLRYIWTPASHGNFPPEKSVRIVG